MPVPGKILTVNQFKDTLKPAQDPMRLMFRWLAHEVLGEMFENLTTVIAVIAAVGLSGLGSLMALKDSETHRTFAITILAAAPFVAALIQPRSAWRWALIPAMSMPLSYYVCEEFLDRQANMNWSTGQALLAFVAPLATAYIGAGLRIALGTAVSKVSKALNLGPKEASQPQAARVTVQSTT